MNWNESIRFYFSKAGINVKKDRIVSLGKYLHLLEKWNKAYNLTGIKQDKWVTRIVIETALLLNHLDKNDFGDMWIDIGSGAGIPGIIVGILIPDQNITLIESRWKKSDFLEFAKRELLLKNVTIMNTRIEKIIEMGFDNEFNIKVAFARAFAKYKKVFSVSFPLLSNGGKIIMTSKDEISDMKRVRVNKRSYKIKVEPIDLRLPGENDLIRYFKVTLLSGE